jgi:predicted glycosyltransferase
MPYLLTTVGGGADGFALTLAAARAKVPKGYHHLVITGPQMPEVQRASVKEAARKRTRVVGSIPDALARIKAASAIVTMGGYNSICEVMSTNVPALVVPRTWPRREQLIRAKAMVSHDLMDMCLPQDLNRHVLQDWFLDVLGSTSDRGRINLSGLTAVPMLAANLVAASSDGEALRKRRADPGGAEPGGVEPEALRRQERAGA